MVTIQKTLNALRQVINPASLKNIVDDGIVKNIVVEQNNVSFDLIVQTQSASVSHEIQLKAEKAVQQLEGVGQVVSNMIKPAQQQPQTRPVSHNPLNKVKHIIAVSSAKGGVGKSTIAAHLAQELCQRNLKVGLVDTDIYGPSVPTLFHLNKVQIFTNDKKQFLPVNHLNLKLMSFGFLLGDKPAVMRGPVVTRYIQQILLNTDWGELDYLLIDMPPGTGDVQLTITQTLRLTGAVIITTPHTLSLIDVARGILMFEKVAVPIIGLIENMAYFKTPSGEKHYIFGRSTAEQLADRFGVEILAEIPVMEELSHGVLATDAPAVIQGAVDTMLKQIQDVKSREMDIPVIKFDHEKVELAWENGEHWLVRNFDLRMISQDALSVNEMTGERLIKANDIRKDIAAREITPLGNYGIGIAWNDGHSSAIYTYKNIRQIALITS